MDEQSADYSWIKYPVSCFSTGKIKKTPIVNEENTRYPFQADQILLLTKINKISINNLKTKKDEEKSHFFNCAANG